MLPENYSSGAIVQHCMHDEMLSHFDTTSVCDRQTDRWTDEQTYGRGMYCTSTSSYGNKAVDCTYR